MSESETGEASANAMPAALELAALGIALTLVTAWMARVPSWFGDLGTFQGLFLVAFVFYGVAIARLSRYAGLPRVGLAVFTVAAACRILLAPLAPSLSGDLFRFVWEGRVWLAGGDPYRQAPLDPALAMLRDARIFPFVNHPELATIYPPLAQAGFALVAWISPTVTAFKLWVALHDLALVAVLLAWSKQERGSAVWALAYAWNPLVLVEYAGSGHNDPTAMLGLAIAFLLCERRPVGSALALAWGGLTKLAPLVALPFLMRRWPWRARIAAVAVLLPGLIVFALETRQADSGLRHYWAEWRNNALVFELVERLLGSFGRARLATLSAVGILLVAAWLRGRGPAQATRSGLRAALVTSPVVHPWYAGWVLMFEPLAPSAPWLLLSGLMALNYGFLATPANGHDFHPPWSWRWIEYGAPVALAVVLGWRARASASIGNQGGRERVS